MPATLHRSLLSTNVIENATLNIRRRMSKVNRWRAKTEMADRYLAAGLLYAESSFRKRSWDTQLYQNHARRKMKTNAILLWEL